MPSKGRYKTYYSDITQKNFAFVLFAKLNLRSGAGKNKLLRVHLLCTVQIELPRGNDDDHVIASAFRERSPHEPGEPGLMSV